MSTTFNNVLKDRLNSIYGISNLTDPNLCLKTTGEMIEEAQEAKEVKWIWVEGYKGTDRNMRCRDYQYHYNTQHDMPEDGDVKICEGGFHFCRDLKSVFQYYNVFEGNRFFKVKALVRENEWNGVPNTSIDSLGYYLHTRSDKYAAKSIILGYELTPDEILAASDTDFTGWTEADKQEALERGIASVRKRYCLSDLVSAGYSDAFSAFLLENGCYKAAMAVASQPELSMDMRCAMILACKD